MAPLGTIAPIFVSMAHRIVWCVTATVGPDGRPRTRVLHPIWEWDGGRLTGWIATTPSSPKADDLAHQPAISLTYWAPDHDTCTADCDTVWETDPDARVAGWERFANGPDPVGYDPAIIPAWESPRSPGFGILRLSPYRLRVLPGSVLMTGEGQALAWRRTSTGT